MTTTEARDILVAKYPNRSYCVTESAWHHHTINTVKMEYSITVMPGLDGTVCSIQTGPLADCLSKTLAQLEVLLATY